MGRGDGRHDGEHDSVIMYPVLLLSYHVICCSINVSIPVQRQSIHKSFDAWMLGMLG